MAEGLILPGVAPPSEAEHLVGWQLQHSVVSTWCGVKKEVEEVVTCTVHKSIWTVSSNLEICLNTKACVQLWILFTIILLCLLTDSLTYMVFVDFKSLALLWLNKMWCTGMYYLCLNWLQVNSSILEEIKLFLSLESAWVISVITTCLPIIHGVIISI